MKRKLRSPGQPEDPVAWLQVRLFNKLGVKLIDWKRGADRNPYMPY
jgi:hypothetical protein